MSNREDYTDQEWQMLLDVPAAVGTAMILVGRSGLGTMKESLTLASQLLRGQEENQGIELIESILSGRIERREKSDIETLNSPYLGLTPERVREDAIERCRQVATLLTSRTDAAEARAYGSWVCSIARKVAESASEGGFLGIGGVRVSEAEQRLLQEVESIFQSPDLDQISAKSR